MLATLHEDLWQLMRKGMGADDMLAAGATKKFDDKWGNPDLFVTQCLPGPVRTRARNARRGVGGHGS